MSLLNSRACQGEWWRKWRFPLLIMLIAALGTCSLWAAWRKHRVDMAEGLVRNPPWLMWGNTQTVTIPSGLAAGNPQRTQQQLVKIAYGRPTTWNFLLAARIISIDSTPALLSSVWVDFNLTTGIGRSQLPIATIDRVAPAMPGFARFVFQGTPINPATHPELCFMWTTSGRTPNLDQSTPLAPIIQNVTSIVAQDLQLNVSIYYFNLAPPPGQPKHQPLTIEIHAYFSPFEHIRPEWFKGLMGNTEDEGR